MARISEQVLAGLARPTMAQGMFDLGAAIGGVPGQMKQKRQEDEFNKLMADAQKAQQANNEAELFSVAQKLRAMGRNTAANTVAATATKLRETNRQKGLASAISSAEQLARQGADVQPLLQDITGLGGTPEQLSGIRSIVDTRAMNEKEGLLQQTLASPGFNLELGSQDVKDYFEGATQMGVTPTRAREIYDSFLGTKGGATYVGAGQFVDTLGNPYDLQVKRDKEGKRIGIEYIPIGTSPKYTGKTPDGKPNPLAKTGAYGLTAAGTVQMEAEEASRTKLETDFAELRVGAVSDLPDLLSTKQGIQEAITLLGSEEMQEAVRTGGVATNVSKGLLRFLGLNAIPEEEGVLQGKIAQAVMQRLQGFTGSISDGERNYSIDTIMNWQAGNKENIGSLSVILKEAQDKINKSIRIGQSSTFDDYRRSSGIVNESDFYTLPKQYRQEAMELVKSKKYTFNEIIDRFSAYEAGR